MRGEQEILDRIKEVKQEIGEIDRQYEEGGYKEGMFEYERDMEKWMQLNTELSTLYWILADF